MQRLKINKVFMYSFEDVTFPLLLHYLSCLQDSAICLAALTSSDEGTGEEKLAMGEDEEEEDDIFETEFRQYKRTYYMTKMGVDVVSE